MSHSCHIASHVTGVKRHVTSHTLKGVTCDAADVNRASGIALDLDHEELLSNGTVGIVNI